MKAQTAKLLTGLAALMAAGITTQAQETQGGSHYPRPCRKCFPILGEQRPDAVYDGARERNHHFASPYSFTTVDDPLGVAPYFAFADGIEGDLIVGQYVDSGGVPHGYVYDDRDQTWTTLDDPLADGYSVNTDIADGKIVGFYGDSEGNYPSFVYDGTTWTTINHPLAAPGPDGGTSAWGVNRDKVMGSYLDANGLNHGFVYSIRDQTWTTLDDPLAGTASGLGTFAEGALGDSVLGFYIDSSGVYHGFIYNGRTWKEVEAPLAGTGEGQGTTLNGVSGNYILADAIDSNGVLLGYIYDGCTWTPMDDPLAGTGPGQGTNPSNGDGHQIVGTYLDSNGAAHGFLATPTPTRH